MADNEDDDNRGDLIAEARKAFKRCADAENENRIAGLEDIRFARLGEQWPDEVVQQRTLERRPMLTINKLPAFIRQVVNDSRQNKPAITVHPVDSKADPKTADVLSGIIRNIESVSNADVAYDTGAEQAVTSGFGYWRVLLGYSYDDSFDLDILIQRITNQFCVYSDPNSTAADSSDWDVCFVTDRITKSEFKRKYGDKANVDFDSDAWSSAGADWQDQDHVIIAEWWRRYEVEREIVLLDDGRIFDAEEIEGNGDLQIALENEQISIVKKRTIKSKRVTQTLISGCDVLKEEEEFPGCYIPIVPVYGDEIIVEGKRYFRSLINSAKDAQRMFNYWRTTATELVALAPKSPWVGPAKAFEAAPEMWATANTKPWSYLPYSDDSPAPPQRVPLDSGPAAGALQEALNASDDIKSIVGMYDASLGARSNETSGKAILARQREGDVSTFHFVDNVARAIRHTGKIIIGLIPHVYTGARIMRVLGEDGEAKNIPVNQEYQVDADGNPIPEGQAAGQMQGPGGPMDQGTPPDESKMAELGEILTAIHDLTVGKYDVTVTSGPSYTTRRVEAATEQMQFLQAFPQAAPVIGDIVAGNLDWPGADEIAKRLAKLNGQSEPQIPPELLQQIEQGQQLLQQLQEENEKLKADQASQQAQTQVDMAKIDVDKQKVSIEGQKAKTAQFEAETERMKTEIEVARARQLQAVGLPIQ
jgi:hypothetical protein